MNGKINAKIWLTLTVFWLLQEVLVPFITIKTASPDLLLLIVAVVGFIEGPVTGGTVGLVAGLLEDLVIPGSVGLNLLIKTLVGFLAGKVERTVFGSSSLMPLIGFFVVSFSAQLMYVFAAFLFGDLIEVATAFKAVMIPSAVYTAFFGLILFKWLTNFLSGGKEVIVFK